MIKRILNKDMRRRKSVNIILFLFIFLASVFLSSSINNILVVNSAVNYYIDYANVPDSNFVVNGTSEKEEMDSWLQKDAPKVKTYDYNTMILLVEKNIDVVKDGKTSDFNAEGTSMYLGTADADYCKVFGQYGEEITLKSGEIAVTQSVMDKNKLNKGDYIRITSGSAGRKFKVRHIIKDAAYGNEIVGLNRMIVTPEDYRQFADNNASAIFGLYYVETSDINEFNRELSSQGFQSLVNSISRDMYVMVYSFDMILAGLLILIGICLILIALLVLRFTLVFTMEEDYREIGIMKAIGIKDFTVQKLYLVKYMVLVVCGSVLGFAVSIPVSRFMIAGVSKNMIMEDSGTNLWVNVLSTVFIIAAVMLFCYGCTRKLRKISVISAISGGHTGKRYKRRKGIRLNQRGRMPVSVFLGVNDVLSSMRRYMMLMIIFCISFILITIPLNTLNTMQSTEMAVKFVMNPESAVYVSGIEAPGESSYDNSSDVLKGMERVEKELGQIGYNAELTAIPIYFFPYGEKGKSQKSNILTIQPLGPEHDFLTYDEGDAPILKNEVAFSRQILEENGWSIGDTVESIIGGKEQQFIITGTYSDYLQTGKSARMNVLADLKNEHIFSCWNIMVNMDTDKSQKETADELNKELPDYEWSDGQSIIDRNVGGIQQSLDKMLLPMTGLLCALIMLITYLMECLFIAREKGEIAMMKSVGYKNRTITLWQVSRIVCVVLVSMVMAVPLSLMSNQWILKPIFAIMGADLTIQVVPWKVYGLYPGVLLLGIILATCGAAYKVKKINIRELNNLE